MKPKSVNRLRLHPEQSCLFRGHHVWVTNRHGMASSGDQGYFLQQTRFLSRFELSVEDERLRAVSCNVVEPHSAVAYYLLRSPAGQRAAPPGDDDPSGGEVVQKAIEIQINSYVGGGFHQDLHISNHGFAESRLCLDWKCEADFADLDEVTSGKRRQTAPVERLFTPGGPGSGELVLAYRHPRIDHATRLRFNVPGLLFNRENGVRAEIVLAPRTTKLLQIDVAPVFLGEAIEPWFCLDGEPTRHFGFAGRSSQWLAECGELTTSNTIVQSAWDRAAADIWSLQALQGDNEEAFTSMAGMPKYTGLFGRDSLMTGIQSTLLNADTLRGALSSVGAWTATDTDDRYDAQPGKVLHQRQLSPLALLGKTPFIHYYGDYSAPGLYVLGAAAHFVQTGDRTAFEAVRANVEATLGWMDRDGDIDGDGFYEYRTLAGAQGIKNQGWKDSRQAVLYPDGSLVEDPIAIAEIQGLYYAAKQSLARACALIGEHERAAELREQSRALKKRFNERFWMPDLNFYAMALGPDKRPVKTIASNAGSCLAYGIIDEDKAAAVASRILEKDMFSGWGVRTLSRQNPGFNPLGYHLGAVWPVSNANLCFGLKRYGLYDAFHKVAKSLFDATQIFDYERLPEVYGGHERGKRNPHPGVYPAACSPQAWSASAIIQICDAMAGIVPVAAKNTLIVDPALPDWAPDLEVRGIRIGERRVSLALRRNCDGIMDCEIKDGGEGVRIYRPDPKVVEGQDRLAAALEVVTAI